MLGPCQKFKVVVFCKYPSAQTIKNIYLNFLFRWSERMIKTNNILFIPSFGFFTSPLIPQSVFQLLSKVITKIRRVSQGELGQTTVDIQTNDEVDELDWYFAQ
jgi:hypothetical protein